MSFKQPITSGTENSVRFSVLNPLDEQDDGFTFNAGGADGTYASVGITFYPYGGTSYYVEPEPFHPYFKTPSASTNYPYFGITSATLFVGSYVSSSLNFLEFNFAFSRNDIKGLVI